jgi:hypothetical protein
MKRVLAHLRHPMAEALTLIDAKKRQLNAAFRSNREMSSKPLATHRIAASGEHRAPMRLVVLRLDDFLAAVVAVRADMVTHMHFTRARLDCERGRRQEIVRAVHAALRRRLLVLLDCHGNS